MTRINRVELSLFYFDVEGLGLPQHGAAGVGNVIANKGEKLRSQRWAVRIETTGGERGEYVTHWVGTQSSFGQALMLAPHLVGRDPDAREAIWQDLKREVRAYDHMGHGPLDIALWDLAGRRRGVSVAALLGGFRDRLPVYASTYHGQNEPGGLGSPEAFAEYAVACRQQGFRGFKIHGWHDGDAKREAANVLTVRKAVGDNWPLMIDPACELRTWSDALYVGHACSATAACCGDVSSSARICRPCCAVRPLLSKRLAAFPSRSSMIVCALWSGARIPRPVTSSITAL